MDKKIVLFIPATLGMLTAFGPFVTDFYLPVLPEMAAFFHTSPALASMSLTTGMIGLAVGQVFIGPLTDKFGRKRILVGSMLLFAVASVLCIVAPSIFVFNLMRLFQGVAGAVASPLVAWGRIEVTSSAVMVAGAVVCLLLCLPLCKRLA